MKTFILQKEEKKQKLLMNDSDLRQQPSLKSIVSGLLTQQSDANCDKAALSPTS